MIPLIKIVACILKILELVLSLVGFTTAVVEALGPPPDPSVLTDAIEEIGEKVAALGDCALMFTSFSFTAIPLPIPNPLCTLIYRLILICVAVLTCIAQLLTLRVQNEEQIEVLQASGDVELQFMANCLIEQQDKLNKLTEAKLDGVKAIITLINALGMAVPPIGAAMGGPIPLVSGGSVSPPESLLEAAAILQVILDNPAFKACAGEAETGLWPSSSVPISSTTRTSTPRRG